MDLLKRIYNSGKTHANKNDLKALKRVTKGGNESVKQIRKQLHPFKHQ